VKAVIVAAGAHAPTDRGVLAGADLVIAADGGADWLARVGGTPDRLVGDLDSVSPDLVSTLSAAGVAIDRHPVDKDASDLELSLAAALAAGADDLVVLGALGGELDHLVGNLLILGSDLVAGRQVRLVHDRTTARMLVGPAELTVDGAAGSRIGLFAVGDAAHGVTTRGLHWPLTDARLEAGSSRGLANVVDDPSAAVALRAGRLLVVQIDPEGSSPATKEGDT
jgi:thiamine pyrophosphokinase